MVIIISSGIIDENNHTKMLYDVTIGCFRGWRVFRSKSRQTLIITEYQPTKILKIKRPALGLG